jgi:hypothetical protein
VLFNTKPLQGEEPEPLETEPVVDKQGNPLKLGEAYYIFPLGEDNGGITLGQTRNKTCPLDVIRNPEAIGSPVFFFTFDFDYIPTVTDIFIEIRILDSPCNEEKIWKISKTEQAYFWFVSTNGRLGHFDSKFKILKLEGEHAYEIYSFMYCPSRPFSLCYPVGTFVDTDGTKVMAFGKDIYDPYYVRFQKVSTFAQEKNQSLSSI